MIEENNDKEELKIILYKVGGAMLGFLFVKAIVFSAEDDFLWHMFWGALFSGEIVWKHIGDVFVSWTFLKLAFGVIIGEFLGGVVAKGALQKFVKNFKEEMDKEDKKEDEK